MNVLLLNTKLNIPFVFREQAKKQMILHARHQPPLHATQLTSYLPGPHSITQPHVNTYRNMINILPDLRDVSICLFAERKIIVTL